MQEWTDTALRRCGEAPRQRISAIVRETSHIASCSGSKGTTVAEVPHRMGLTRTPETYIKVSFRMQPSRRVKITWVGVAKQLSGAFSGRTERVPMPTQRVHHVDV